MAGGPSSTAPSDRRWTGSSGERTWRSTASPRSARRLVGDHQSALVGLRPTRHQPRPLSLRNQPRTSREAVSVPATTPHHPGRHRTRHTSLVTTRFRHPAAGAALTLASCSRGQRDVYRWTDPVPDLRAPMAARTSRVGLQKGFRWFRPGIMASGVSMVSAGFTGFDAHRRSVAYRSTRCGAPCHAGPGATASADERG